MDSVEAIRILANKEGISIRKLKRQKRSVLRKTHRNSKFNFLPDDQHTQLCEWLLSSMSYQEIADRVAKEFNFTTSRQALSNFYYKHVADHVIQERARRLDLVGKINKDIKKHPAQYDESAVDALMERIHTIARDNDGNVKHLKIYTDSVARLRTLRLAEDDLNLKLRRLSMLERRERQAKDALKDSKLTPEEQAKHLREIFGK